MARVRTPNFHDARLSVAQSMIRELIARHSPSAAGLKAGHPLMRAANHVLDQVSRGHMTEARVAVVAYTAFRAAQTGVESTLGHIVGTVERCIDLGVHYALAWVLDDRDKMNEIRGEWIDNACDLEGWATALDEWIRYHEMQKPPRYMPPLNAAGEEQAPYATPAPFALPPSTHGRLRVGVLGDWGTGEDDAFAVLDQLMTHSPDIIIHVGDVYYSGTAAEQNSHLLEPLRRARERHNVPVYVLPGNHDYYSGGDGFYGVLPKLNEGVRDAAVQANSFWALTNAWWQLEGMDTGYHDSDLLDVNTDMTRLREHEAAWHAQQLSSAGTRTVILFSHHQLFSRFEAINKNAWRNPILEDTLQSWQQVTPNIAAWFWGHEHVLEVYEVPGSPDQKSVPPLPILGRCIGNGAFPMFTGESYTPNPDSNVATLHATESPSGIPFPSNFVQSQADDEVWSSGYMTLDLADGGPATATYYQVRFDGNVENATSQVLWAETIPAGTGGVVNQPGGN
ncbi:metallophosphoesterase family protein [Longimicrobium terrae]|uniref:Calcineurin-like phosphoesterase domain-containing protein n=1 Tax=Longimicrobium terrae TaxID=1639882 RepID=A0A841GV20_9BACT|nr:metallophosphoesterase [Longimicrobium terrae]MBB4634625.1 hypothetical protein [Longimicrobium terrae]MBB6068485.1 hypothetical protein [Longimicrobium terrae]NNC27675.1 hypothetical protein [Longimicrobium terrae]